MNSWDKLIAGFNTAERPIIEALIHFARGTLGIDDLRAFAEVNPQELANVLVTITGDIPFTYEDDAARLALAQRNIQVAREVLAGAGATTPSAHPPEPQSASTPKPQPA